MTDAWDERTEAIPGTKGEKSFELELDFVDGDADTALLARPSVVVFEPTGIGLADALADMGFDVRMGTTGVDVMSVVAQDAPGVVLCAPAPDAERRRLLAAALRLRFPQIPIVYVSTHAAQEDAVLGALREGARAVLAWPLPRADEVMRVLAPYLAPAGAAGAAGAAFSSGAAGAAGAYAKGKAPTGLSDTGPSPRSPSNPVSAPPPAQRTRPQPRTIPGLDPRDDDDENAATSKHQRARVVRPPASAEAEFEDQATVLTPSLAAQAAVPPGAAGVSPPVASPVPDVAPLGGTPPGAFARAPREVPQRVPGFADEPNTQPNMRPAAAAVEEALAEKRGELGDLLAAVSPFLWSLEDASRWAAELGAQGDPVAQSHARTLTLLAKILAQLQARIDDIGA